MTQIHLNRTFIQTNACSVISNEYSYIRYVLALVSNLFNEYPLKCRKRILFPNEYSFVSFRTNIRIFGIFFSALIITWLFYNFSLINLFNGLLWIWNKLYTVGHRYDEHQRTV